MSSWHLQGDMKDGELVSSGGVCVGKCSLFFFFFFLAYRARERSRPETDAVFQVEERLSSDSEGMHFK